MPTSVSACSIPAESAPTAWYAARPVKDVSRPCQSRNSAGPNVDRATLRSGLVLNTTTS